MPRTLCWLIAAASICLVVPSASSQLLTLRSIQFTGDNEYTDQELLATAGLKIGDQVDGAKIGEYGQRLINTGVFSQLSYKFNGQDLIFQIAPAPELLPIRIDNLPLVPGSQLTNELHSTLPLFHGKVPASGGLNDDVARALEKLLAVQGLTATVQAAASATPGNAGVVTYSVISPSVEIGQIKLSAKSVKPDAGAQNILNTLVGSHYQIDGSPSQISTYLGNYYRDKGYIEAAIDVAPHGIAEAGANSIRIPFEITVAPGILYRLDAVHLAPDLVVTQAEFDRQSFIHPGDIADGQRVTQNWEYIARQYHNHGFMKASIHPEPTFDRFKGTVSYAITAEPGPVYSMGTLTIENVTDDLRAAILSAWKMPAGSTFNEGAIRGFAATNGVNPILERVFASVNLKYVLTPHDDTRTVDVVLRLEKKH